MAPIDPANRREIEERHNYQATRDGAKNFRISFLVHPLEIFVCGNKQSNHHRLQFLKRDLASINEAEQLVNYFRFDVFDYDLVRRIFFRRMVSAKINLWAGNSRPRTLKSTSLDGMPWNNSWSCAVDNSSRQVIDTDRGLHGGGSANKTESNFTCDRILNKQI